MLLVSKDIATMYHGLAKGSEMDTKKWRARATRTVPLEIDNLGMGIIFARKNNKRGVVIKFLYANSLANSKRYERIFYAFPVHRITNDHRKVASTGVWDNRRQAII